MKVTVDGKKITSDLTKGHDHHSWLAANGYKANGPVDGKGDTYSKGGKKFNIHHYKNINHLYVDSLNDKGDFERGPKFESLVYDMIASMLDEGTRGETGLVGADGKLTHAGYAAMYAWKKAKHTGQHPGIANEREMLRKRVVKDV